MRTSLTTFSLYRVIYRLERQKGDPEAPLEIDFLILQDSNKFKQDLLKINGDIAQDGSSNIISKFFTETSSTYLLLRLDITFVIHTHPLSNTIMLYTDISLNIELT